MSGCFPPLSGDTANSSLRLKPYIFLEISLRKEAIALQSSSTVRAFILRKNALSLAKSCSMGLRSPIPMYLSPPQQRTPLDEPDRAASGNRQLTRPAGERGDSPPAQGHDHGDMYGYSLWCLFCRSPHSLQIGRPPVTVQEQRIFSAEGLKVVPIFTKTQATLNGRSANERKARPGSSFQSFLLAPFHWQRGRPRSSHHERRGWS
jgi:hypothetical protein